MAQRGAESLQRVADRRVEQHGVERPPERPVGVHDAEGVPRARPGRDGFVEPPLLVGHRGGGDAGNPARAGILGTMWFAAAFSPRSTARRPRSARGRGGARQFRARRHHTSARGVSPVRSSRVPPLTMRVSGRSWSTVKIGVPQSPQNRRSRRWPFSVPVVWWTLGVPSSSPRPAPPGRCPRTPIPRGAGSRHSGTGRHRRAGRRTGSRWRRRGRGLFGWRRADRVMARSPSPGWAARGRTRTWTVRGGGNSSIATASSPDLSLLKRPTA